MKQILQLLLLLALVGIVSAGVFSWAECKLHECCDEPYVKPDFKKMGEELKQLLFGQHIVQDTVIPAIQAHFERQHQKPLVLSFNGGPGSGKNYVAKIIAENIFLKGLDSKHVHQFSAVTDFPDKSATEHYKRQLQRQIRSSVASCGKSMFIFDEVDKLSDQLLTSIKPYLEYKDKVDGVDFRKSIFIFLSNAGSKAISEITVAQRANGKPRTKLRASDLEKDVIKHIYNSPGGLKMSELIENHLIDHFIPFLPLEREHVRKCIMVYIRTHDIAAVRDEALVDEILNDLIYFPNEDPVFCTSGCKRIEQKSVVPLSEWKAKRFGNGNREKNHDDL